MRLPCLAPRPASSVYLYGPVFHGEAFFNMLRILKESTDRLNVNIDDNDDDHAYLRVTIEGMTAEVECSEDGGPSAMPPSEACV